MLNKKNYFEISNKNEVKKLSKIHHCQYTKIYPETKIIFQFNLNYYDRKNFRTSISNLNF